MISRELEAEILRLYHAEHWRVGTVVRQLHLHHATVRCVPPRRVSAAEQSVRRSMADPLLPFIQDAPHTPSDSAGQSPSRSSHWRYERRGTPRFGSGSHSRSLRLACLERRANGLSAALQWESLLGGSSMLGAEVLNAVNCVGFRKMTLHWLQAENCVS